MPSTGYRWAVGAEGARTGLDAAWASRRCYFTKRTAEAWLRDVLDQAHKGTLSGMVRTWTAPPCAVATRRRATWPGFGRCACTNMPMFGSGVLMFGLIAA